MPDLCLQRSLCGDPRARQETGPCTASQPRQGELGGSEAARRRQQESLARRLTLPVYCLAACACPADPVHEPDLADRSTVQRSSCVCASRLLAARVAAEHPLRRPPLSAALASRPADLQEQRAVPMFASTSTAAPSRPSRSPRRRSPLARAARTALALAVAGTAISAVNGAMYEPPEGQVMLGFWFDPANRKSAAALRPPLSSSRARPSTTHRRHQRRNAPRVVASRLALVPA